MCRVYVLQLDVRKKREPCSTGSTELPVPVHIVGYEMNANSGQFRSACTVHERVCKSVTHPTTQIPSPALAMAMKKHAKRFANKGKTYDAKRVLGPVPSYFTVPLC